MTTKRTRFDRRKKPEPQAALATNFPIAPDCSTAPATPDEPAPTHKLPTAPWRLLRPVSGHVLYRKGVAIADAAHKLARDHAEKQEQADEAFDAWWEINIAPYEDTPLDAT